MKDKKVPFYLSRADIDPTKILETVIDLNKMSPAHSLPNHCFNGLYICSKRYFVLYQLNNCSGTRKERSIEEKIISESLV